MAQRVTTDSVAPGTTIRIIKADKYNFQDNFKKIRISDELLRLLKIKTDSYLRLTVQIISWII